MSKHEKPFLPRASNAIRVSREVDVEPSDIAYAGAEAVYAFVTDVDNLAQSWELTLRLADYFDQQRKKHREQLGEDLPRKSFRWTFSVDGVQTKLARGSGPWDIGAGVADIRLPALVAHQHLSVSQQHAQIFVDTNGAVRVRDVAPYNLGLYSTRVHYVDGDCGAVSEEYQLDAAGGESRSLSSGSIIAIGPHRITVEFVEDSAQLGG